MSTAPNIWRTSSTEVNGIWKLGSSGGSSLASDAGRLTVYDENRALSRNATPNLESVTSFVNCRAVPLTLHHPSVICRKSYTFLCYLNMHPGCKVDTSQQLRERSRRRSDRSKKRLRLRCHLVCLALHLMNDNARKIKNQKNAMGAQGRIS